MVKFRSAPSIRSRLPVAVTALLLGGGLALLHAGYLRQGVGGLQSQAAATTLLDAFWRLGAASDAGVSTTPGDGGSEAVAGVPGDPGHEGSGHAASAPAAAPTDPGDGSSSGTVGDAGLDAAIEARIPRYWAELERICPDRQWRPYREFPPELRTSAAHSQLEPPGAFRGLGRWHMLRLLSFTASGQRKTQGGDVWWVVLHDNSTQARLPARVFDEGDGSYSLAYVALVPGSYFVRARLYYTLCAGFQDPMATYEKELQDRREDAHCYEAQVREFSDHLVVIPAGGGFRRIPDAAGGNGQDPALEGAALAAQAAAAAAAEAPSAPPAVGAPALSEGVPALQLTGPVLRADHYVYRAGPFRTWGLPLNASGPQPSDGLQLHAEGGPRPAWRLAAGTSVHRLLMWGDSTIKRTFNNLEALARFPCRLVSPAVPRMHLEQYRDPHRCKVVPSGESDPLLEGALRGCTGGPQWGSVPVAVDNYPENYESAFQANLTDWVFNDTFAKAAGVYPPPKEFTLVFVDGWGVRPVDWLVKQAEVLDSGDAVIINVGAHAVRQLAYPDWKVYVDTLAEGLAASKASYVWRTTMPILEYVMRNKNGSTFFSQGHFQNDARRVLFDSYAEFRMRAAGIRVWDIAAYAGAGSYRPTDMFHMDGLTMRGINLDMAEHVMC